MIWNSIPLMTAIDLIILAIAAFVIWSFIGIGKRDQLSVNKLGLRFILLGILAVSLFYIVDLVAMHVLPLFIPMAKAMMFMEKLHLNVSWLVILIAVATIARGLIKFKREQQEIHRRDAILQLLLRVARDANQAKSLEEALQNTLTDVCEYNGWPVGHAYTRSELSPDLLVPTGIWHLDDPKRFATFQEVTEKTNFKLGVGLPGRVMATGRPAWIVDVTKDSNFPRAKLADDIGVKAGFACPVLVGSKVVAVLEFFAPEAVEPDQNLLDSLVQVGLLLGRVAERERAEQGLKEKNKLVNLLRRAASEANEATSFGEAMHTCLATVNDFTGWSVGHVYLLSDEEDDLLVPSGIWHLEDPKRFTAFVEATKKTSFKRGVGLPGRVLESGKPAWITDVTQDPNFPRAKLAEDIGVRSAFAFPVLAGDEVVAVLEFFDKQVVEPDDSLLATGVHIGSQLGRVFERKRAEDKLAEKNQLLVSINRRMNENLEAAARIQRTLLPSSKLHSDQVSLAWAYLPCDELGGDFLNYFWLDDTHLALYVLDVSGHGVPAALLSVAVAGNLSPKIDPASIVYKYDKDGHRDAFCHPGEVATRLNQIYPMSDHGSHFFSLVYAILDVDSRELMYACCGHPGPIIIRSAREIRYLETPDTIIGALPDSKFKTISIPLRAEDRVYFYSDGLFEQPNVSGDRLGQEKLASMLAGLQSETLPSALSSLINEIKKWAGDRKFEDDISIISLEFK